MRNVRANHRNVFKIADDSTVTKTSSRQEWISTGKFVLSLIICYGISQMLQSFDVAMNIIRDINLQITSNP